MFPRNLVTTYFRIVRGVIGDTNGTFEDKSHQTRWRLTLLLHDATVPIGSYIGTRNSRSVVFSVNEAEVRLTPDTFDFSVISRGEISLLAVYVTAHY